jgi:replicative DNA helicase
MRGIAGGRRDRTLEPSRASVTTRAAAKRDLILGKHPVGPTTTIPVAHQLHLSRFKDVAC